MGETIGKKAATKILYHKLKSSKLGSTKDKWGSIMEEVRATVLGGGKDWERMTIIRRATRSGIREERGVAKKEEGISKKG